ncbi:MULTISPECIES: glutamine ABC transporter substrate-binding protein [Ralstonia]|uniref:Glutamine-binding periplasmic protein n=1 Tax=Ralstonia mannitolilytica TaxID=105219 RepID=A0AAJ4ZMV7_9RALS|nr:MULTISPECIES: glutamine ABC transporter substrate-binding protein [Ralstonia]AJW46033.1 ABC transporter permease [Ralstonia mannitolilytica]MBU9577829.1 glutamine ABC transporter substrate-binding protein [Ralstonia mannitolilytica]PLT19936.1 glutamine ABC transporter substrate-binding protein [Ralstonia mannitolilytica]QIF08258.1 glutamine ABC transporter substrate-binding protein [Ralstonia mannitolilytica]CAG2144338.1 Glutamine-binding periplasmic protein [Ralstonia mannitolilytica]
MGNRRQFMHSMLACAVALSAAVSFATAAHAAAEPLRVATDATFAPMEFVENGKRTGFDIDLIEALARTMGRPVEWTDIDFKGLVPGLVSRRFDVAISGIYITPERKKVVDFTEPYYHGGLVAMVKQGNTAIKTPADLAGKKVSVQVGTKSVNFLKENYPKVERVEVEKNEQMFNLVEIGRADAAVTGRPAAAYYVKMRPGLRLVEPALTTEEYGIAVRRDQPELTKALNAALEKIKADGTYDQIVKKWFGAAAK